MIAGEGLIIVKILVQRCSLDRNQAKRDRDQDTEYAIVSEFFYDNGEEPHTCQNVAVNYTVQQYRK